VSNLVHVPNDTRWVASVVERLVSRRTVSPAGCWEWNGCTDDHGYGTIRLNSATGDWAERCHRIAYVLFRGYVKDGLRVLHSCDNRLCFNPSHLFLGTAQDNTDDMHAKGRWVPPEHHCGEDSRSCKLKECDVIQIIERSLSGATRTELAKEFGVTIGAISLIVLGKNWKHVSRGCGVKKSTRGVKSDHRTAAV
jgi:hypothetical protein